MGGFFGVVSNQSCVSDVFYGTDYHSHLGTVRGGMAFSDGNIFHRSIHDISNSPFRTKFESDYSKYLLDDELKSGVGTISDTDDQPLLFYSHLGKFALVTVGLITNMTQLIEELFDDKNIHFSAMQDGEITQTEVVGTLINSKETILEGLLYAQKKIFGSCSLLLLNSNNELYASRDYFGRTPIAIGEKEGAISASLESCSFANLGFTHKRDLGPGEIVKITHDKIEVLNPPNKEMSLCSFFYIYYGYPASSYEGINVEESRYKNGARLAQANEGEKADIVAGIPDSGVGHALGYADQSKIRYARPFVKYTPTWPRSFTPTQQSKRQHIAQMKLIPIPALIKDKEIIFCDDSIVRGTQLRDQVKNIKKEGAKAIHMRIACPPLIYPCKFLNFSRSKTVLDLATRRIINEFEGPNADLSKYRDATGEPYKKMVEKIRENLGLDSLSFQTIDDLKKALNLKGICTYCWTGEDISMPGDCSKGCSSCPHKCPSKSE